MFIDTCDLRHRLGINPLVVLSLIDRSCDVAVRARSVPVMQSLNYTGQVIFMSKHTKLRIFVVDDREVIARTLATILNKSGYAAIHFTNPLDALAMAAHEAPDYLISDVVMPELSGVDLAIHISDLYPDCKILLFSGQAATDDLLANARAKGRIFELLCKPVHPTEILHRVRDQASRVARSARANCATVARPKFGCQSIIHSPLKQIRRAIQAAA